MKRSALISTSFILINLVSACVLTDKQIGDDESAEDETGDGDGDGDATGDGDGEPTGDGDPGDPCTEPKLVEDQDCDGVGLVCDNARDHHNPDQLDQDGDGFGDVNDLCPLVASVQNTADSDNDGIGNPCDRCPHTAAHYNDLIMTTIVDSRLWVRNVPTNADFDQDGVGDACDNCVTVANCHDYGPDNPAPHDADTQDCQADDSAVGIGAACLDAQTMLPINGPSAAGPVGFAATDDFDQDGINNFEDACPRLPLGDERLACTDDIDCNPPASNAFRCADTPANDGVRYCNHRDVDGDLVGDACDTCPNSPNPMQVTDIGMQIDDEDGDFIGAECETNSACNIRRDPRRTGFYDLSVGGLCCVTMYPGDDVLHDPDGVPIRLECSSEDQQAGICRELPAAIASQPGYVELPPGCEAEATALILDDVGGDALALWAKACLLPAVDQDFDAIGDACDLCPFSFDPYNAPYVDNLGMLWPDDGEACNGDYAPQTTPGAMCEPI